MSNKAISVYAEAFKRQQQEAQQPNTQTATSKVTQEVTPVREPSREQPRGNSRVAETHTSRGKARSKSRDFPTRDEIQEFSFRLRDELKVKVQAEVPHHWQRDLEELARDLNVKKLELYRYIIGAFLGKVNHKPSS